MIQALCATLGMHGTLKQTRVCKLGIPDTCLLTVSKVVCAAVRHAAAAADTEAIVWCWDRRKGGVSSARACNAIKLPPNCEILLFNCTEQTAHCRVRKPSSSTTACTSSTSSGDKPARSHLRTAASTASRNHTLLSPRESDTEQSWSLSQASARPALLQVGVERKHTGRLGEDRAFDRVLKRGCSGVSMPSRMFVPVERSPSGQGLPFVSIVCAGFTGVRVQSARRTAFRAVRTTTVAA